MDNRYTVQIKRNGRWILDGTWDNYESACAYAERCLTLEDLESRVIVEKIEVLKEFKK